MDNHMAQPTTTPVEMSTSTGLKTTMDILKTICSPLAYVLRYIIFAILFVLKLLYLPIRFLLQPFVHFGRFILALAAMPFRLAAKFETLYIYLGVAAIVGLLGGCLVAGIYMLLYKFLNLETPIPAPELRTAKEYREQKQKRAEKTPILSPRLLSPVSGHASVSDGAIKGGRSLLATAIMEEEDSDF